jgi:hypothetical protein
MRHLLLWGLLARWALQWSRTKFAGPTGSIPLQRSANGLDHRIPNFRWGPETHLTFRGVNIHVDGAGIHLNEEKRHGVLPLHERRVIAFAQSLGERNVFYSTSIEKAKLLLTRRPTHPSAPDVT